MTVLPVEVPHASSRLCSKGSALRSGASWGRAHRNPPQRNRRDDQEHHGKLICRWRCSGKRCDAAAKRGRASQLPYVVN
jgi:hypothetical protein